MGRIEFVKPKDPIFLQGFAPHPSREIISLHPDLQKLTFLRRI